MPSLVPLRRSYSATEDDENVTDNEQDSRSETATVRSDDQSNKRARLEVDGDGSNIHGNSHTDVANVLANEARRVAPEHKPGSIVRVTLTNFVTYTAASFYPGPALNMVIGPNGTGKSTLVCAICLGLGWGPKHLGRAKDPGEFVKHGSNEAIIEIELKGHPGKRNPVIRRQIKREGNKSSYFLNDNSSTQHNILNLAREFGIQIDNLCHFLPQDRVVEFAGLSPIERLDSTQRAAAPEYMVQWHEELKKLRVEQKNGEKLQAEVKHNLTNLEGRQNLQRADVERIRERQMLVEKVAMLEKLRPVAEHAATKIKHDEARERKKLLQNELTLLKERVRPALRAVTAKQEYKNRIDKAFNFQRTILEKTTASFAKCTTNRDKTQAGIASCVTKREVQQKLEQDRRKTLAAIQNNIRRLEVLMQEPRIEVDTADYNERVREKTRQKRALQEETEDIGRTTMERNRLIIEKTAQMDTAEKELKSLESESGKQYTKLKNLSPDTFKAWEWIQANQSKFKGKVYGPPIVECTIPDKRYLVQVENLIRNKSELCAITCTEEADFTFLQNQLNGVLRLHELFVRTAKRPLADFQPPAVEDMQSLGLEAWAVDYVKGPEPVLAMLCAEARLHITGVTSRELNQTQYDALTQTAVTSWSSAREMYSITRRKEYTNFVSTKVVQLKSAVFYTDQAVDPEVEQNIKQRIITLSSEIEDFQKQNEQVANKVKELKAEQRALGDEISKLEEEKAQKQRAAGEQNAIPGKLNTQKERLAECMATESTIREQIMAIREEETGLILQKGQLSIDFSNQIDSSRKMLVKFIEARVVQIEATSDLEELTMRNRSVNEELGSKQKEVEQAERAVKARKDDYRRIIETLKKAFDEDPNLQPFLMSLTEEEQLRTPEELNMEIETQNARLELLHEGDPRAVREYESRAKEIERLQHQAAEHGESLEALEQSIAEIRTKWEPELDALVSKISAAFASSFEKINCAGAVEVYKEGEDGRDFEGWAIHIQVKFRENEPLSLLDSHRQSGGERAVSTIFYLMALQTLSRAPFRVVDEINQGMDPRNERMVHERMVDIACGTEVLRQVGEDGEELVNGHEEEEVQGSQYFLITPKLLSDLKYKPGMKVHCIASGEFMPSDHKQLDFKSLLKKAQGLFGRKNLVC